MKSRVRPSRIPRLVTLAFIALLVLSGCSLGSAQTQNKKEETLTLETRLQKAQVGGVTLTTTWLNPSRSTAAPIQLKVQMDIHGGSLDEYDLARLSTLANDSGQQVKAVRWDPPGGGHHGSGTLSFPATDSTGKPLVNADTKYIEWTLRGLAGVPEKIIKWEITP